MVVHFLNVGRVYVRGPAHCVILAVRLDCNFWNASVATVHTVLQRILVIAFEFGALRISLPRAVECALSEGHDCLENKKHKTQSFHFQPPFPGAGQILSLGRREVKGSRELGTQESPLSAGDLGIWLGGPAICVSSFCSLERSR